MMINRWLKIVWDIAGQPGFVTGVRKVSMNQSAEIPWAKFLSCEVDFTDICYSRAKFRQLERNYWNTDEVDAAVEKIIKRKGKPHTSVSIQLRGGEKDSRSQGYCMQNMVITVAQGQSYVDVYYRSTELIQKFLADLIFFSQVLPPVFERAEITPEVVRFKFANTYISAVFMPIFMRYEDSPVRFFAELRASDPRFFRTCGLATRKFFQETHNYTYRTRVKMFEYCKEHVAPSKLNKLVPMLKALTGAEEEDEEDEE